MSIATLPIQAIAINDDGLPWYPVRVDDDGVVLYIQNPVLPTPQSTWATATDEFADRPHVDLDEDHLTQILYLVPNLYVVTDDQVPEILTDYLRSCRCDPNRLALWTGDSSGVDAFHAAHMRQARQIARQWLAGGGGVA